MVKIFRVDDRLIHGQVQTQWLSVCNANRVIIIDNNVVKDPVAIQILKLAKPANIDLIVSGEEKGILYIKKDQQQNSRTFVIFKTIETAWHMVQAGIQIPSLVIGPCSSKPGAEFMSKNAYFTKAEIGAASSLHQNGTEITFQLVPEDSKTTWESIINKKEKES